VQSGMVLKVWAPPRTRENGREVFEGTKLMCVGSPVVNCAASTAGARDVEKNQVRLETTEGNRKKDP